MGFPPVTLDQCGNFTQQAQKSNGSLIRSVFHGIQPAGRVNINANA
jgi:hypothetical protein